LISQRPGNPNVVHAVSRCASAMCQPRPLIRRQRVTSTHHQMGRHAQRHRRRYGVSMTASCGQPHHQRQS
jgi:hypothetical protein